MSNEALLADALVLLKDFRAEVPGFKADFRNEVINKLEGALRAANNKANGKSGLEAAAKTILKSAKKAKNPSLHGAWIAPNGKQYVCDGVTLMEIDEPIELEPLPDNVKQFGTDVIMAARNTSDMKFELPPLAELKSQIAEQKAKAKSEGRKKYIIVYCFGNGLAIEAERLLNAIKATDANVLRTTDSRNKDGNIIASCFVKGNGATILLLPMRVGDGYLDTIGCIVL